LPKLLTPLPTEIKELILLIREGRLFDVQKWIKEGRSIHLPKDGNFYVFPLLVAVRTGFHSMVEVLLGAPDNDADVLDRALCEAVHSRRLDMVELLHRFGARPDSIRYDCIISSNNRLILRWFEDHGVDLETDDPLAEALSRRDRGALGTLMRCKERIPQLKRQADMALRFHARVGDIKWVSLLLWAGADPRVPVPEIKPRYPDKTEGTALEDAVSRGHLEIVKKFKIDPIRDDLNTLLFDAGSFVSREIVETLLSLGADPRAGREHTTVQRYFWRLEQELECASNFSGKYRELTDILCLFASKGAQWSPPEECSLGYLRRALAKANPAHSLEVLTRFIDSGLISIEIFKELMSTPRMKKLLQSGRPGVIKLRQIAGLPQRNR
jgi:hypothetical protein